MDLSIIPSRWRAPSNTSHRPELIQYARMEYIPVWLVQSTGQPYHWLEDKAETFPYSVRGNSKNRIKIRCFKMAFWCFAIAGILCRAVLVAALDGKRGRNSLLSSGHPISPRHSIAHGWEQPSREMTCFLAASLVFAMTSELETFHCSAGGP